MRRFDQEGVPDLTAQQVVRQGSQHVLGRIAGGGDTLRPYQEYLRIGQILPASDHVRAELDKIKVRVVEPIVSRTVAVFVYRKLITVTRDLVRSKHHKAVVEVSGGRVATHPIETAVLSLRHKGLTVVLDG